MAEMDIDDLFAQTLQGDYDDEAPWEAVRALRRIGTRRVFERAANWVGSSEPLVRARGLDVLAQLGKTAEHPSNSFPDESYAVVTRALREERDLQPLNSAISALGHLDNPRAVPMIAEFHSHPSAEIRFTVACALGCFPNDPLSVRTLLTLLRDTDDDVRDWATFGLGALGNCDSSEIREALCSRLKDTSADVREEALVGLGKRQETRALPVLISALEQPEITDRVVEAAYTMLGLDETRTTGPLRTTSAPCDNAFISDQCLT